MAELFTFVGIGGAVLLIVACWLEARGRRTAVQRSEPDPDESPAATKAAAH